MERTLPSPIKDIQRWELCLGRSLLECGTMSLISVLSCKQLYRLLTFWLIVSLVLASSIIIYILGFGSCYLKWTNIITLVSLPFIWKWNIEYNNKISKSNENCNVDIFLISFSQHLCHFLNLTINNYPLGKNEEMHYTKKNIIFEKYFTIYYIFII